VIFILRLMLRLAVLWGRRKREGCGWVAG
jgi:hypothetical protein